MNPPEAVMCWACYTPLSGGAASAPGSSPASGPVVGESGNSGKAPIAPWQMGVVGVAVLLGLGFGAKTMFGSNEDGGDDTKVTAPAADAGTAPAPAPPPPSNAPPPPTPVASAPAGLQVPAPQTAPFSIVATPNAQFTWGTMAIVLTDPGTSNERAAALAAFVRQKMMQNKKWLILHIYVFSDKDAAAKFRAYQARRKGAPLGPDDFAALTDVWARAPVRYEYNRGSEGILLPSRNPSSWWTAKTTYVRVKN